MELKRRQGPDILIKFIKWVGIISWFILFIVATLITKAQPETENFFTQIFHAKVRKVWDMHLFQYSFSLMLLLFIIAITALIANSKRHRRATDKYNPSVIIMLILSSLGLIWLGINYFNSIFS